MTIRANKLKRIHYKLVVNTFNINFNSPDFQFLLPLFGIDTGAVMSQWVPHIKTISCWKFQIININKSFPVYFISFRITRPDSDYRKVLVCIGKAITSAFKACPWFLKSDHFYRCYGLPKLTPCRGSKSLEKEGGEYFKEQSLGEGGALFWL